MVFTLTLSSKSEIRVRARYQTGDGSAVSGADYVSKTGEVVFDPGVVSRNVSIAVMGDIVPEPNETLHLDLDTPTNATVATPRSSGTIVNDDGTP